MPNLKNLPKLSHLKSDISEIVVKCIIIIQAGQILSFLLPNSGWGIWRYQDNQLKLVQIIASAFVGTPLLIQANMKSLAFIITIILFVIMLLILIILIFQKQSMKYFHLIQYLLLFATNILFIPCMSLFIEQIICGDNSLNFECSIGAQIIFNAFCAVLFMILVLMTQYFLRSYSFQPFNLMQLKFNPLQPIINLLISFIIALNSMESDITLSYIELAVLHIMFVLQTRMYAINQPSTPSINQFVLKIMVTLWVLCIIVTLCVITDDYIIGERQLIIYLMLFGSLAFAVSQTIKVQNAINLTQNIYLLSHQNDIFQYLIKIKQHLNSCNREESKKMPIQKLAFPVIFCILNEEIQMHQKQQNYEELQLFYISFLGYYCKKPLVGYVELKKLLLFDDQSYYFKLMQSEISQYLEQLIVKQQKRKNNIVGQGYVEKQLETHQIINSIFLQDQFIIRFVDILNSKCNLWNQQIKGFNNIFELEKISRTLSNKILKLEKSLQENIVINLKQLDHIPLNTDVIQIKFASFYFSAIKNDYYSTQICETTIQEILAIEQTQSSDIITNLKLIEEKVVVIMVSMVQKRGQIVNKRNYGNYFGYSDTYYENIININQIMPQFIQCHHDQLLLNYLSTGRSKLFSQYSTVFSVDQTGYLRAQQLKLDNNFKQMDDYIIVGCLSQIKVNQDFLIFGEDGRMLGATKEVFESMIKDSDDNFTINRMISQVFIFMLMPDLVKIINQFRNNSDRNYNVVQDQTILYAHNDLKMVIKQLMEFNLKYKQYSTKMLNSELTGGRSLKMLYSQLGEQSSLGNDSQQSNSYNDNHLFSDSYQQWITEFLNQVQWQNASKYKIKYLITQNCIGNKLKNYFVIEITEMVKNDPFNESNNYQSANTSVQNNQHYSNTRELSSQLSSKLNEGIISEITPYKQIQLIPQQLLPDSARDSLSYGPLSQRVNFISPTSKQYQLDELIDQEIVVLQAEMEQFENQEQQQSQQPHKSSSNHKSNNILKILKFHKSKVHDHNEEEKLEFDVQKSKSSGTSGTSGVSAIAIIKKFQQNTDMIYSLKTITFINLLTMVIIVIYVVIQLITIDNNDKAIINKQDEINGPLKFNRYFCKIFQFTWSLLFNGFQVIESSNFLLNTIIEQLQQTAEIVYVDFADFFSIFIGVEQRGLLKPIELDLLYQDDELVSFTTFNNYILNIIQALLKAKDVTIDNLVILETTEYIDNLIILRYNLKNVVYVSLELIVELNALFYEYLTQIMQQMQIIVSIEILGLALVFFTQIYYWRQIEIYIQQIMLLLGRLQEGNALEMIHRMNQIKQTLIDDSGKSNWKKSDFHQLSFQQQNQTNIMRTQQHSDNNKRKNISTILSSRIYQTQISISKQIIIILVTYLIFLMYLLGGYLLFQSQADKLSSSQDLSLDFIRFSSDFDMLAASALVIKTESLMYQEFLDRGIYTTKQIEMLKDPKKVMLNNFITYNSIYNQNLSRIYDNIQRSTRISADDKVILNNIYSEDICLSLKSSIKFCEFDSNFADKYGTYSEFDDNREYLNSGIIGLVSRFDVLINQIFQYELNNLEYNPDNDELLNEVKTKEFNNAILQHFIDTTDATKLFLDILESSTVSIMTEDLQNIYLYYLITGILILTIYFIFYCIWIIRTNQRLICIRLSLVNLPIDIITDQHTLSQIKRMH